MPKALYDEDGNAVGELPDDVEFKSFTEKAAEADKLRDELKALEDKSAGVKSLRDAVNRKEERIAALQKEVDEARAASKKETVQEGISTPVTDEEKLRSVIRDETAKAFLSTEIDRRLAGLPEDDRKEVRKAFDKLTVGEVLNADTLPVFIRQAESAAFPERAASRVRMGYGRAATPSYSSDDKGFGDTEDGKEFAKKMGIRIESPEDKKNKK